ncbi:hypothetical protein BT93_L1757 [Corymbia citriodora subsp. variegata]|uniref:Phosphoglycerate mutase n=1 Tax=Corymbia citriodora subsp. variegata TaxID=360336 RepID=A0A8T0CM58_CORYI|nr:hypothetical protein BT93_L1757 [Corymbia citriodora subsp. variegata]
MLGSNSRVAADLGCNGNAQSVPIGIAYAEIVVVRHGETEWNADKRIQGHLDIELNEIGRRQATAVIKDPSLRERNLGELQGLRHAAAARVCPKAFKVLRSQKTDREIPGGGESIDQVYQRSTTCLRNISMKHKGRPSQINSLAERY